MTTTLRPTALAVQLDDVTAGYDEQIGRAHV